MKLDASRDLAGIRSAVAQGRIDLGARERGVLDERRRGIGLLGEIIHPHRDLPYIGTAEQPGPPTGWPVAKHDQWMFLTTSTFFGVATQTIRERLTGSARPETKILGQGIIEAHRHVDRHVCNVAQRHRRT